MIQCGPLKMEDTLYIVDNIERDLTEHTIINVHKPNEDQSFEFDITDLHLEHTRALKRGAVLMIGFEFGFRNAIGWFSSSDNDRARLRAFNKVFGLDVVTTMDTWSKEEDTCHNFVHVPKGNKPLTKKALKVNSSYNEPKFTKNWPNHLHFCHEMTMISVNGTRKKLKGNWRGLNDIKNRMLTNHRIYHTVFFDYNRAIAAYYKPICEAFPKWLLSFYDCISDGGNCYILEIEYLCNVLEDLTMKEKEQLSKSFKVEAVYPLECPLYYVTALTDELTEKTKKEINSTPIKYDSVTHMFSKWTKRISETSSVVEIENYIKSFRGRLKKRLSWLKLNN
jgi:hypothetical protein